MTISREEASQSVRSAMRSIVERQHIEDERLLYASELRNGRLDAKLIFEHIMESVRNYEEILKDDEEIGLKLANFGEASEIHIREIKYKNPNIIEFCGKNLNGNDCKLIQHISQLNFLIVSLKPIEDKPYRIGFVTGSDSK